MHAGETLFVQLMFFLPDYEFQKCVERLIASLFLITHTRRGFR